ncbi:MAG: TonB-dependent receptor [Bryobacterales bacterium]|nr:TonB-dependent receptor [Bryobacteraceae bacterium]MDW8129294.1 TonB-dependent receptor [Bryobacterales bacterium]
MFLPLCLLAAFGLTMIQSEGVISGIVRDARSGEPLARVRIALAGTTWRSQTDGEGRFVLSGLPPGQYTLQAVTVGYRTVRRTFTLSEAGQIEFEIALSPETFHQTESVEVTADVFEPLRTDSPSEITMAGDEIKNLGSVLADDPLRAAQALPGIRSNDDFDGRFSLRGASWERIGLYLDDILLHVPFHTLQGESATGSMAIFNGDMVETMALHAAAPPARFADRTGGILEVTTREGGRIARSFRATASASNAAVMAEGPLGRGRRGSWLASARKSYFQYIIRRTATTEPTIAFGFADGQGKLSYDLTPHHHVDLTVLEGYADLDRTRSRPRLGVNSVMLAENHITLASAGWRYTPPARVVASSRIAWMRERFENLSRDHLALAGGYYGEWSWTGNATWLWRDDASLEFGASARRLRADGFVYRYQFNPFLVRRLDEYRGVALRGGGYLQQSLRPWHGRLQLTAGGRWDKHSASRPDPWNPSASIAVAPRTATRIYAAWGRYAQFPDLHWLHSFLGGPGLRPERATHYSAGWEQRLGERTRLRLEAYQREDRELLFRPLYEPRLAAGRILPQRLDAPVSNSLRGRARGVEIFLQQRTANRLTGWIAYAYGQSRMQDAVTGARFPADFDQKHGLNVYLGYRVRPTVHVSMRWIYGSGFPIPGFLRKEGERYFLAEERNRVRLPAYHRVDLRTNKAFVFDRWKLTLYAEVINLTNHANYRFESFNGYNARTGQAFLTLDKMFPVIPSAGFLLEF